MGEFDLSDTSVKFGLDLLDAMSEDIVTMQRRWNRKNIDWKISEEGIAVEARIQRLDRLCETLEWALPVLEATDGG